MIRERTEGTGPRPAAQPQPAPAPQAPPPRARSAWEDAVQVLRRHPVIAGAGVLLLGFVLASLARRRR